MEWNPIETAPYNVRILVWVKPRRPQEWMPIGRCYIGMKNDYGVWLEKKNCEQETYFNHYENPKITHWMPIPEVPQN